MSTSNQAASTEIKLDVPFELKDVCLKSDQAEVVSLENSVRTEDLDRREHALNARLAAFESEVRRFEIQRRSKPSVESLKAREKELGEVALEYEKKVEELARRANELDARDADARRFEARLLEFEKELERKEASLDAREKELEQKSAALSSREETARRLREENAVATLRLLETKDKLDEEERKFKERSQSALDAIREQKEILLQIRQNIERQVA